MRRKKRGQSVLEYSLLVAGIIAALLLVQQYVKRAYEGKVKASADELGKQFDAEKAEESYTAAWKTLGTGTTTSVESTDATGSSTSTTSSSETVERREQEAWGDQQAEGITYPNF